MKDAHGKQIKVGDWVNAPDNFGLCEIIALYNFTTFGPFVHCRRYNYTKFRDHLKLLNSDKIFLLSEEDITALILAGKV